MKTLPFVLLVSFAVAASAITAEAQVGPWNLSELKKAPPMRWAE